MPGRVRSTKKLAQRIDLNYFKRLYPFPRWRRILSFGLTGAALLWLGWEGLAGKQQPYNAGPLAYSHALLTNHCESCHATAAVFGKKVTDRACLACHDGPEHQAQQMFTPACTDCHVEHQASFRLAFTKDQSCTQCHADLKTKSGKTVVTANITSFDSGHPEFAALRTGYRDPGTIRFGHAVHLKKDLRGPRGPVQLKCMDCHARQESSMAPIDYQKHCAECHPLDFDQRFSEPAPHKKPEIVVDFVVRKFTQYIAAHPQEIHMADPADPRILRPPLRPARDAAEWISRRVSDTEQLLWRKTCKECHTLSFNDGNFRDGAALPDVAPAEIKTRWFTHAWFDHESHQMLTCTECHGRAPASQETADVLLPGIQTCQRCHRSGPAAAEARCFECHVYHDWTKEKKIDGKELIRQLAANERK